MFSFIISFTDILLALFLCGPKTVTIQLRIFNYLEWNHDPFVAAIGVIQIIGILVGTIVLEKTVGLERLF
jgi:putative spermidine/putrescine transport system permease protein